MPGILTVLLAGLCFSTIGFSALVITAAREFFRRPVPVDPGFHPPVSILIPLCGTQPDALENFSSFCRQDYPEYQLLFSVRSERDPSVETVRELIRRFPERDIQMVVGRTDLGANPKVNNLRTAEAQARHPFLAICDSDIRVGSGYLTRIVQPLRDSAVGAVTCMCRSLSKGWVGTVESLRESTEFCPGVLAAWKTEGIRFTLGSTAVVRREALEKIGGLASIADYLADDFMLGKRIADAGFSVVLSQEVVEHSLATRCFTALVRRQIRWNRGIRASRPWGYRGLLLTYGIPAGLLLTVVNGGSSWSWVLLGVTLLARLVMAYEVGVRQLKDRAVRRFLWAVPAQDLLSFVFWCLGLAGRAVDWRGQRFTLTSEGKLTEHAEALTR